MASITASLTSLDAARPKVIMGTITGRSPWTRGKLRCDMLRRESVRSLLGQGDPMTTQFGLCRRGTFAVTKDLQRITLGARRGRRERIWSGCVVDEVAKGRSAAYVGE